MSIESLLETRVEREPRSTLVKFYYNEETDAIERITLDSEDGETPLFPIKLESGKSYIPNLDEFDFKRRDISLQTNSSGSSYVEKFEDLEHYLEGDLCANTFDNSFLRFLRDTFPSGYAQLVIEQMAVRGHIHRNRRHISKPEYYPGKEEYGMKYLPCSESLQYAHILNKVLCICNDPPTYPFDQEYFSYKELKEIDKAFDAALYSIAHEESSPSQSKLAGELLLYRNFDFLRKGQTVLERYLYCSFKLEDCKAGIQGWKSELRLLGKWSKKKEEE
jgi:hypothetical protein